MSEAVDVFLIPSASFTDLNDCGLEAFVSTLPFVFSMSADGVAVTSFSSVAFFFRFLLDPAAFLSE